MLELGGVIGNRRFWLRDEQDALYAGKRDGSMLRIRPEWDEETRRLALTFPYGDVVEGVVELGDEVEANMYSWHRVRVAQGPWAVGGGDLGLRRPAAGVPLGGRRRGRPDTARRDRVARLARVARAAARGGGLRRRGRRAPLPDAVRDRRRRRARGGRVDRRRGARRRGDARASTATSAAASSRRAIRTPASPTCRRSRRSRPTVATDEPSRCRSGCTAPCSSPDACESAT